MPAQPAPPISFLGAWTSTQAYTVGQAVSWNGSSYIALIINSGRTPGQSPTYWGLLAEQGSTGPAGPTGAIGTQGVIGPAGPTGSQGLTGLTGPTGPSGPSGATGVAGSTGPAGLTYRSTYNALFNYAVDDAITFQGATYISIAAPNTDNTPGLSPSFWSLLAAAGSTGTIGASGATGVQGQPGVVGPTGATGLQGSAGALGATGAAGATGPAGATGVVGATGPAGASGSTGAAGSTGATGPQGPPISFSGTWSTTTSYSTGAAVSYGGSSYIALFANSGREPDQTPQYWSLLAQQGAAGATGATGSQGSAGSLGLTGAAGPIGPAGAAGPAGATGAAGVAGTTGSIGATGVTGAIGPAGLTYLGAYQALSNYALNDAITFQGSTYISLVAGNHDQTPGQSPSYWSVLAQEGTAGAAGTTGATGPQGLAGSAGSAGSAGAPGPQGATGTAGAVSMIFLGPWSSSSGYVTNDAVTYNGSTYIAVSANSNAAPALYTAIWTLLAQQGSTGATGSAGPAGPAGTATIVSIGTVATGTTATVSNSGTNNEAVLNFTFPQTETSGLPAISTYHSLTAVSGFYSVNSSAAAASESSSEVLTWVPNGCTATKLSVYSQEGSSVAATLRQGTPGNMSATPLSCQVAPNSCTATENFTIPAGSFVDLSITTSTIGTDVWTLLICN